MTGAIAVGALAAAPAANAFRLSDGSSIQCVVRGVAAREYAAPADDPIMRDRTGMTFPEGKGYATAWNMTKLAALPPAVHDFLFFHECAHALIPTSNELAANCGGLKDMRAAGRAGPTVEGKLAAFFGAGNAYWESTVKCADRPPNPADPPGTLAVPRPPG